METLRLGIDRSIVRQFRHRCEIGRALFIAIAAVIFLVGGPLLRAQCYNTGGSFSGGDIEDNECFNIPGPNGAVLNISFDMFSIPDQMVVRQLDTNQILFNSGLVQSTGGVTRQAAPGTVKITMNPGGGQSGTAWNYTVTITPGTSPYLTGTGAYPKLVKDDPFVRLDSSVSDPVDTATGAHIIHRTLLALSGARRLTFEIDYNSLIANNGPVGVGWSHNHQTSVEALLDGTIVVHWNNKRQNLFRPVTGQPGAFTCADQTAAFYTLVRNLNSSFTLTYKDQTRWNFDSSGRLVNQINPIGQQITYSYNGSGKDPIQIREPISGKAFNLTYDAVSGEVLQVSDNTGRTVSFGYDAALRGRLEAITTSDGVTSQTYRYKYDDSDPNNVNFTGYLPEDSVNPVFTDYYDDAGRVSEQTDSFGAATDFSYDETSEPGKVTTTVNDRTGADSIFVCDSNYRLLSKTDPLGNTVAYTYDVNGMRTSAADGNQNTTFFAYDSSGNLTSSQDPAGKQTTFLYDSSNRMTRITNPFGKISTLTYDTANRLTGTTDFAGNHTTLTYNTTNSLLLSQTLPRGGIRQFAYTAGLLTQVTDPTGFISRLAYDAKGRPIAALDPAGQQTTFAYDLNDHLITRTDSLGHSVSYTYDSRGLKQTETDSLGQKTNFYYDGNECLTDIDDAAGNNTHYDYDAEDRLIAIHDANGHVTNLHYDNAGRLIDTTDPLGHVTSFVYDNAGNRTGIIDPLGNQVAQVTFDVRNLPVTVQDALNRVATSSYDDMRRLHSRTDPLNRTTGFAYDDLGRLLSATNPLSQITSQTFDGDSNLSILVDARNGRSTFSYDLAGRRTALTLPGGDRTSYVYNSRGLLTQVTEPSGQQTNLGYDNAGRRTSLSDPAGSITYTYDANNRLLTTVQGSKTISRQYDALGRLTRFTDGDGNVIGYAYDAVGNLTALTYPDGKVVSYVYDAANRLTTVTDWASRATTYLYDADGRVIRVDHADRSVETRTYDAAGELTQIRDITQVGPRVARINYICDRTFDASGQVTSENLVPSSVSQPLEITAMTYDANNRLITFKGQTVSYDPDSNMISGPLGSNPSAAFTYDSRNRLTAAGTLQYAYDAEDRRIAVTDTGAGTTTRFVYDPRKRLGQLLVQNNPNGTVTRYVYGLGLIADDTDGAYRVYHFDSRGSTIALTNSSGSILLGQIGYGAFGEVTRTQGDTSTPFLFNGRLGVQTDSNGLYYMRARYYDPAIRRFVNQDPILRFLAGVDSDLNRFAYANGNPVSFVDPFGLAADSSYDVFVSDSTHLAPPPPGPLSKITPLNALFEAMEVKKSLTGTSDFWGAVTAELESKKNSGTNDILTYMAYTDAEHLALEADVASRWFGPLIQFSGTQPGTFAGEVARVPVEFLGAGAGIFYNLVKAVDIESANITGISLAASPFKGGLWQAGVIKFGGDSIFAGSPPSWRDIEFSAAGARIGIDFPKGGL